MPTDRDIRELRGVIDPRLGKMLIEMNGDIKALRQGIGQLAMIAQELAAGMQVQTGALSEMHKTLRPNYEALKKMGMEVSSDPSVTGEVDEKL